MLFAKTIKDTAQSLGIVDATMQWNVSPAEEGRNPPNQQGGCSKSLEKQIKRGNEQIDKVSRSLA